MAIQLGAAQKTTLQRRVWSSSRPLRWIEFGRHLIRVGLPAHDRNTLQPLMKLSDACDFCPRMHPSRRVAVPTAPWPHSPSKPSPTSRSAGSSTSVFNAASTMSAASAATSLSEVSNICAAAYQPPSCCRTTLMSTPACLKRAEVTRLRRQPDVGQVTQQQQRHRSVRWRPLRQWHVGGDPRLRPQRFSCGGQLVV